MTAITASLPLGVALQEGLVYEGVPTLCPRCRESTPIVVLFARRADGDRVVLHCGCLTEAERNGAEAPQTFDSEAVRVAAQKQVREKLRRMA